MTQTPSRDWQKDMEWAQRRADADEYEGWTEPLIYWLQEAKVYKQSYNAVLSLLNKEQVDHSITKDREQRLKEEIEGALRFIGRTEHIPEETVAGFIRAHFNQALITLYPDTTAPTTTNEEEGR